MDTSMIPIYLLICIPIIILINYLNRARLEKAEKLKKGIGRGVAGFQTGVRRVAIPAEIMERIRRGEEVSGEEITRAQERMAAIDNNHSNDSHTPIKKTNVDEQWLPNSSPNGKKLKQRKK
ncbi:hypothetical protein MJO28_016312 [Puccinia striiformis f. sp. tritici]|uniref:Uncharacterized protein n=4 Tax=Puccinia striiformis TaxID=27350 RepID=A0A0L0W068_9BASI|nr:hypothetical protein Pst134EB_031103 [Puccinia striiformis f. sp. tritici]KNF04660.1 hypothetical protein PSTG_02145 [Puccinia striiformis f. sp. tritici PST-78]POV97097.1 hypothetical protein PSTT_15282 [Puccinia striiformis]KAI7935050.1 hypothetical protein MJO29_016313 [Puccinia striiformis f. sp. tritici]KAI7935441.1 hypothetical protein MJO28_016312 [Puccinia striiformis f. sp. tritici]